MRIRVEPFTVGDFVHVYNRGNRKMDIFPDVSDKWHFLKILRFFNHQGPSEYIFHKITRQRGFDPTHPFKFEWPEDWGPIKPLVKIINYDLKKNHFHLTLKEIIKGGISLFMKKLGDGFTLFINLKYKEVGKVFQGSYRGRTPKGDIKNLHYLDAYIQVFNPFEEYPGGIEAALKEFDKAFEFALNDPFSSLGESFGKRNLGIIDRDILAEAFPNLETYKEFVKDALLVRNTREILGKLTME